MTAELDAFLIRSLPELNEAAVRLDALSADLDRAVDAEIAAWASRNGWAGRGESHENGLTWLAPPDWMVPDAPNEEAYLYFWLDETGATPGNKWHLAHYVIGDAQRMGLWLGFDTVTKPNFKRLFRDTDLAAGLPMHGSEICLPLLIDREALAAAAESGSMADALSSIRNTLDQLPALAQHLQPLRDAIVAAGVKTR